MTIQFAEDFKGYGTDIAFMLNGLYGQVSGALVEDPDPNVTGNVFRATVNPTPGFRLRRVFTGARTTAGFCFRLWMENLPNTDRMVFGFLNGANARQVSITSDSTGKIAVLRPDDTQIAITASPVLVANAWNHIEVRAVASATVGTIEIRVNGVTVLTANTLNTGTSYEQFCETAFGSSETANYFIKDLVTWDGLGTRNNDFLGTVQVIGRTPSSDVLTGWTPASGTSQFQMINNSPPLDATEYLTAPFPLPTPSSFGLSQLPADTTSVKAMIVQSRVRNTDGGDGNFQASLVSGAATGNGANRPMTSAFTYYEDLFELDPNTAAAWTVAAANAAVLRINRTV